MRARHLIGNMSRGRLQGVGTREEKDFGACGSHRVRLEVLLVECEGVELLRQLLSYHVALDQS